MAQYWVVRVWQEFFAHAARHPSPKLGKDETYLDLPKSPHEWASVIITEEASSRLRAAGNPFLLAVRTPDGLVRGIGSEVFLNYLTYLEKSLATNGYYLHCFPVLAMARLVVGELSPRPLVWPMMALVNLRLHSICQKLHMEEQAKIWMDLADGESPSSHSLSILHVTSLVC